MDGGATLYHPCGMGHQCSIAIECHKRDDILMPPDECQSITAEIIQLFRDTGYWLGEENTNGQY